MPGPGEVQSWYERAQYEAQLQDQQFRRAAWLVVLGVPSLVVLLVVLLIWG